MKTIEIKLYKFSELSENAQQKALENLFDINVDYEWWESIYEDAENIGLKITSFDIDRGGYCNGDIISAHIDTANAILREHGESCETYKTSKNFLNEYLPLKEKFESENEGWYYEDENDSDELRDEFLKSLLEDYRIILQNEYEYLTSKEAIIESIEANDYDFTEDGKIY